MILLNIVLVKYNERERENLFELYRPHHNAGVRSAVQLSD